jgi:hypothetical protein
MKPVMWSSLSWSAAVGFMPAKSERCRGFSTTGTERVVVAFSCASCSARVGLEMACSGEIESSSKKRAAKVIFDRDIVVNKSLICVYPMDGAEMDASTIRNTQMSFDSFRDECEFYRLEPVMRKSLSLFTETSSVPLQAVRLMSSVSMRKLCVIVCC